MKRVLVTGASGFVGRAALAPLIARGFDIHAVGRRPLTIAGVTSHSLDLLAADPAPLLAAVAPTHLLHLAWVAEPGKFWAAPDNLDWLAASLRLVRGFAAAAGRRLTVAGSCAEYDWRVPFLDEATTPLAPATLYGTAKAALFQTLIAAAPVLGLSVGWGRVFFPFGPGEPAGRLLPDVITGITAGRRVACSDGTQIRDFLHVDDVAGALVALLDSDVAGAVNIASGDARPLRDIVGIAAAAAGDPALIDWGARPRQAHEPDRLEANVARLRDEVGYRPHWALATGLADMVRERISAATPASAQPPS